MVMVALTMIAPSIYKNGAGFGEANFFVKSLTSKKNFPIFVALLEKHHFETICRQEKSVSVIKWRRTSARNVVVRIAIRSVCVTATINREF